METNGIASVCSQTEATLAALSSRLRSLEEQQAALLASYQNTSFTLDNMQSLALITPTLNNITMYSTKLSRLKKQMSQQTATVGQLQRRANELKELKGKNKSRIARKVEREGELDRTVYRAQWRDDTRATATTAAAKPTTNTMSSTADPDTASAMMSGSSGIAAETGISNVLRDGGLTSATLTPSEEFTSRAVVPHASEGGGSNQQQVRLITRKKKKARQVDIQ